MKQHHRKICANNDSDKSTNKNNKRMIRTSPLAIRLVVYMIIIVMPIKMVAAQVILTTSRTIVIMQIVKILSKK